MAMRCGCGGAMKPIKRVVNVKGDHMVKGQFYKCERCQRLDLTSETWQRVAVTERNEVAKASL